MKTNKIEFLVVVNEYPHHHVSNVMQEHHLSITLLVDGKHLSDNGTSPIDIVGILSDSVHYNVDLWTCSCGSSGCLGEQQCDCNIVKRTDDIVTLLLRQKGKVKMFNIEKEQLRVALFDVLGKVQELESNEQYNITCSDFGYYQLERYGEYTFGDNLMNRLREVFND